MSNYFSGKNYTKLLQVKYDEVRKTLCATLLTLQNNITILTNNHIF
jgi:hypothetical protein